MYTGAIVLCRFLVVQLIVIAASMASSAVSQFTSKSCAPCQMWKRGLYSVVERGAPYTLQHRVYLGQCYINCVYQL